MVARARCALGRTDMQTCRHDVIVKAQTGSGKTLTYLVPMVAQAPLEYPWSAPEYPWSTPGVPLTYLVPMVCAGNANRAAACMQRTTYNRRSTPRSKVQRATYNVQHATCNMQRAMLLVHHCNVQRATHNRQHAACVVRPTTSWTPRRTPRCAVLRPARLAAPRRIMLHRVVVCCIASSYVAPRRCMLHRVVVCCTGRRNALSCSLARTRRS